MFGRDRTPKLNIEMWERENGTKAAGEVKVMQGHFPTPTEAIAEGWGMPQIMKDCKRMTKADLTDETLLKLHEYGLSTHKIGELYHLSQTVVAKRIRRDIRANTPPAGATRHDIRHWEIVWQYRVWNMSCPGLRNV